MPRLFMHQHLINHMNNAVPSLFFIIAAIVRIFYSEKFTKRSPAGIHGKPIFEVESGINLHSFNLWHTGSSNPNRMFIPGISS